MSTSSDATARRTARRRRSRAMWHQMQFVLSSHVIMRRLICFGIQFRLVRRRDD